jgi:hypothetical protein
VNAAVTNVTTPPTCDTNACSIVHGVGLVWTARGGERSTFDGRDGSGRHCGYATNIFGPWTVYLTPWASGREGRLVLGPFGDAPEAMAAADEYAATHTEGADHRPSPD